MSIVSDADYLIHQLRIQFLKSEDRMGDRIITFPTVDKLMENPYIQAAGPYPELHYSISPGIQFQGDYYFGDGAATGDEYAGGPMRTGAPSALTSSHTIRPGQASAAASRLRSQESTVVANTTDSMPRGQSTGPSSTGKTSEGTWNTRSSGRTLVPVSPGSQPQGSLRSTRKAGQSSASQPYAANPDIPPVPPLPVTINAAASPAVQPRVEPSLTKDSSPSQPQPPYTLADGSLENLVEEHTSDETQRPQEPISQVNHLRTSLMPSESRPMNLRYDPQRVSIYDPGQARVSRVFSSLSADSDDGIDLEADDSSAQVRREFPASPLINTNLPLPNGSLEFSELRPTEPLGTLPTTKGGVRGLPRPAERPSKTHRHVRDSLELPKRFNASRQSHAPEKSPTTDDSSTPEEIFTRVAVSPGEPSLASPPPSGLSLLLIEKKESRNNPFAAQYRTLSGQGDMNPLLLDIFLPHSEEPREPMKITIKRNATVEDVIGFTLFQYIDTDRKPSLTEDQHHTHQWNIRMVEDDGDIDEDFPVLDQSRLIAKFAADQFALCEAPTNQAAKRSPAKRGHPLGARVPLTSSNTRPQDIYAAALDGRHSLLVPNATGGSHPQTQSQNQAYRLVKVHIHSTVESLRTTTMSLDPSLSLYQILYRICSKWQLDNEQYILTTADTTVPLDLKLTLDSLPPLAELYLYLKGTTFNVFGNDNTRPFSIIFEQGVSDQLMKAPATTQDKTLAPPPSLNALLATPMHSARSAPLSRSAVSNKHPSDAAVLVSHTGLSTGVSATDGTTLPLTNARHLRPMVPDLTHIYRQYTVIRRMPMFTGHERTLIINGEYIHISPTEQKHMFDSMKESMHHISAIVSCNVNQKSPRKFKLVVLKDQGNKSYDMEAATANAAQEIATIIDLLRRRYQSDL
ncbi:Component of a membrane-bound complex containing the Tor2p kinase [Dispira parvispora]|uniref:Component of a membrane-bound complex containing the Tor2p kinase n=1 Tax=Dispira parvispora TaxID=1520584 RepID=A0A9W8E733_9FUNG|nr:Component of a membrane-bound complex containing the Tor2p kinase [Dispira parvispora]